MIKLLNVNVNLNVRMQYTENPNLIHGSDSI